MPELPEVETVRSALEDNFKGMVIESLTVSGKKMRLPMPDNLKKVLKGATLKKHRRRGKYILIDIVTKDGIDWVLLLHLGMSGLVRIYPKGKSQHEKDRHDHLILDTQKGKRMVLNDPRRFGGIALFRRVCEDTHYLLYHLGVEPLSNDLNGASLQELFKEKRAAVKPVLLDQGIIAGIGNIYACEILYEAGISPFCSAGKISKEGCEKLACAIKKVLKKAIEAGGTTLEDDGYMQPDGELGYFAQELKVYDRKGKKCHGCSGRIIRKKQLERSTYYCKHCQS